MGFLHWRRACSAHKKLSSIGEHCNLGATSVHQLKAYYVPGDIVSVRDVYVS